jgi:hypothetical protein
VFALALGASRPQGFSGMLIPCRARSQTNRPASEDCGKIIRRHAILSSPIYFFRVSLACSNAAVGRREALSSRHSVPPKAIIPYTIHPDFYVAIYLLRYPTYNIFDELFYVILQQHNNCFSHLL